MDRRRFVPKPEGLEDRALLSTIFNNSSHSSNNPASDVPVTFDQKMLRIAHLPYYLQDLQSGRYVSTPQMKELQADLASVAGNLHKPDPQALVNFNLLMRSLAPHTTLRAQDTVALDHAFTTIIANAGATPQQTAALSQDMVQLAQIDSQSRQPVYLATNDYAMVLQTVLGIGRPIQRPEMPSIALDSGTRTILGHAISKYHRPTFVGNYGVGNSVSPYSSGGSSGFNSNGDIVQVINSNDEVVGQSQVSAKNGDYRVTVTTPMPNGVYTFWVRAVDPAGHVSKLSQPYKVKVRSRLPMPVITGEAFPQGPQIFQG